MPDLLELLKDERAMVRSLAGEALSLIGPKALPPLLRNLDSTDPLVREGTVGALGRMRVAADKSAPALRKLVKDEDHRVRHEAAAALVNLEREDPAVIALLI